MIPLSVRLVRKISSKGRWEAQRPDDGKMMTLQADWSFFLDVGDLLGLEIDEEVRGVHTLNPLSTHIEIPRSDEYVSEIVRKLYGKQFAAVLTTMESEMRVYSSDTFAELLDSLCDSIVGPYGDSVSSGNDVLSKITKWWFQNVVKRRVRHLHLGDGHSGDIEEYIEDKLYFWNLSLNQYYWKVKRNPLKVLSIEYERALALASMFGIKYSEKDLKLNKVARYIFNASSEKGHSHVSGERLKKKFPQIDEIWEDLSRSYEVVYNDTYGPAYYMKKNFEAEEGLARQIATLVRANPPHQHPNPQFELKTITDEQKEAVTMSLNNSLSILSGGPGRGKTTIIKEVCKNLALLEGQDSYVMTALTGMAVNRISSATGESAQTTHHLITLGKLGNHDKVTTIIVDESSMGVTWVLYELLKYYTPRRLILVGDVKQIQPIDWGCAFRQLFTYNKLAQEFPGAPLIANKILKVNHRTKEPILTFGKDGLLQPNPRCIFSSGGINKVMDHYRQLLKDGCNPHEIAILTPYVKCVAELNVECQKLIFSMKRETRCLYDEKYGVTWFVGDRVLLKKKVYIQSKKTFLYNGSIGKVIDLNLKTDSMVVEFDDVTVDIILAPIKFKPLRADTITTRHLKHAYSYTVHSAQGNEWVCVLFYVPDKIKSPQFFNFNLIYTAITRAKLLLHIVGDIKGFQTHFGIMKDPPEEKLAIMIGKFLGVTSG